MTPAAHTSLAGSTLDDSTCAQPDQVRAQRMPAAVKACPQPVPGSCAEHWRRASHVRDTVCVSCLPACLLVCPRPTSGAMYHGVPSSPRSVRGSLAGSKNTASPKSVCSTEQGAGGACGCITHLHWSARQAQSPPSGQTARADSHKSSQHTDTSQETRPWRATDNMPRTYGLQG